MVEGGMVEGGMAEDMAVPCPYQNVGCCLSFEIDGQLKIQNFFNSGAVI